VTPLIAIDGPGGSGKSTVARAVAERLGLERLDTGAMYRAVTLLALRNGGPHRAGGVGSHERVGGAPDEPAIRELATTMALEVADRVILNGEDVTDAIRTSEVDRAVSEVAALPAVRLELVRRQRAWADAHGGGVVEGRDIGSVVFPDADLKVYLTADAEVRARRREVAHDALARRDGLDSSRVMSPLQVAPGAIVVDSTDMSVDEVVEEVISRL
jgi:cytidylate kinase